jgi:hypothetical protein
MRRLSRLVPIVLAGLLGVGLLPLRAAESRFLSHAPIRPLPVPSNRPLAGGVERYVDATRGKDEQDGSKARPWRTINHALKQLKPGQTLYLRGGVYYENVYCALAGKKDAPITLRSYPGELAIIDGGLREFAEDAVGAWTPCPDGAKGEYRSTRPYRNIRDVVGLFGDSLIGLQTYWHAMDLRAANEQWIDDPEKKIMVKPVYCGPGLWYDRQTGHIHVRLAHTHIDNPQVPDYRGETDPRKLPLIIAPFNSVPLFIDQAAHVRFQDLVVRGGGHNSVVLQFGIGIEFDNVTIYAGTYGLRARGTGPLRLIDSAIRGMIPPWAFRDENSLYTYSPRFYDPFLPPAQPTNQRNIARLPTHAVLVTEGSYEFEVFHYPYNHDWDVSRCEFTDGHDGVYLSGHDIRFHHNWIDNIQDDAVYLSSPSPYFNDRIYIYQNLITRSLMAFSCHSRGGPEGSIYIYRNVVDLRQGVNVSRPSPSAPHGRLASYHIFLTHGRELLGMESLYFYQNTFVSPALSGGYAHRTWSNTSDRTVRRSFNNLFIYLNGYPAPEEANAPLHDIQLDGNLHWSSVPGAQVPKQFLESARACKASQHNKAKYPPGWEASSFVADPRFERFQPAAEAEADYRLRADSPAVGKGVVLPKEWEDPLRLRAEVRPDIGALPRGSESPRFGRGGRITFPITGKGKTSRPPGEGKR